MRIRFANSLFGALLPLVVCVTGGAVSNDTLGSVNAPIVAAWSSVPVPSVISANGASYSVEPDGYLSAAVHSGVLPNIVNSMLRTSATSPGTWTDITGKGLSNGSEFLGAVDMTP